MSVRKLVVVHSRLLEVRLKEADLTGRVADHRKLVVDVGAHVALVVVRSREQVPPLVLRSLPVDLLLLEYLFLWQRDV